MHYIIYINGRYCGYIENECNVAHTFGSIAEAAKLNGWKASLYCEETNELIDKVDRKRGN